MDREFEATLREYGYSLTKPRQTVFAALQHHEPQSMAELVQACDDIDRASVYRTAELFESLGIMQRLYIGWKYKLELTDSFTSHHHHATCTSCGKIVALAENKNIERQLRVMALSSGFLPRDHQIEIRGLCADCQATSHEKP